MSRLSSNSVLRLVLWLMLGASLPLLTLLAAGQVNPDAGLMGRALNLYRQGDCDGAVPLLQQVLQRQPQNAAFRKMLAQCLLKQQRWDEARVQFEMVIRDSPRDMDAAEGAKAALSQLQKVEEKSQLQVFQTRVASEEQLRLKHDMDNVDALLKRGRNAEAEQLLKSLVQQHPRWILPRQRLAEFYSTNSQFAEAAEVYRSLATDSQTRLLFLRRAAQNMEWGGDYAEAAVLYRSYVQKKPADVATRMALANVLAHEQQWADAAAELQQVLQAKPNQVQAQALLAQCYEQLGDADKALAAYQRAIHLDPNDRGSRQAYDRLKKYFDEEPLRKGYAALEKGDWKQGAEEFANYLQKHPQDNDVALRIARIYSAHEDFDSARRYYDRLLKAKPDDPALRRERLQMEMWARNYGAARQQLEAIVRAPGATAADYEALVQACVWSGDLMAARPYAEQLAKLQPDNAVAAQTLRDIHERERYEARATADRLAADKQFPEAIEAYRRYMTAYGGDPQTELLLCRLRSWGRDFSNAAACYRDFLAAHPDDSVARMEMADILSWTGRYSDAQIQYQRLLVADPKQIAALLGVARALEFRHEDPTRVEAAYRQVLAADPGNAEARGKVEELHPLLAPQLLVSHDSFSDSDGLYWALENLRVTFTRPGRLKISPYFMSGYFQQQRTIGGQDPKVLALNQKIQNLGSAILGHGGGLGMEWTPNPHWSVSGDLGALSFDVPRTSVNGRAQIIYRPDGKRSFGMTYIHRDAIFDAWTLATLAAGIMGDTALVSSQQSFGDKLRLGVQGGVTRYSRGTDSQFNSSTQRRLWAQLDYPVQSWLRVGYVFRVSGLTAASPLYFSPSLYQTHGVSYAIEHAINDRLRFTATGDFSYSRTDGTDAFEMGSLPAASWKAGKGLTLDIGYRFSLGRTSAFGVPAYRTQGGEIRLRKTF